MEREFWVEGNTQHRTPDPEKIQKALARQPLAHRKESQFSIKMSQCLELRQVDCWSGLGLVETGKEQNGVVTSKTLGCSEEETDSLFTYLFPCEFSWVSINNG